MSRVPSCPVRSFSVRRDRACARSRQKAADGYPPYNIERVARRTASPSACASRWRSPASPAISSTSRWRRKLVIRGRQQEDKARQYLHRGIAARQFQRTFVLADGMEVLGADLKNGLLVDRPRPARAGTSGEDDQHHGATRTEPKPELDT